MNFDDLLLPVNKTELYDQFTLPAGVKMRRSMVVSYLDLIGSVETLRECDYYFRRYPFKGLPVSRHRHLLNVCEMA